MLVWQQPTRRCRCFDRLSLILSAILVCFIYSRSKSASNNAVNSKREFRPSNFVNTIAVESVDSSTNSSHYKSFLNPFRSEKSTLHVNDIMTAYSYSNFGLDTSKERPIKTILFWNEAYGSKDYGIGFGRQGFERLNCPISDCFTTDNRSLLNTVDEYDAIVFHLRTFNPKDLPITRSEKQRWIFWSLESPQYNMQDIYPLNGLFNWTMTYRLDSDVVQPYGWVQPTTGSINFQLKQHELYKQMKLAAEKEIKTTTKKKKLVAWFVSNCKSKSQRENYANALAKHIQIDVYGDCGSLRCDRDKTTDCYAMLEKDYKFYLSFENSFCDDYVTEKLFSIFELELVPIVFGGANYSAVAPPFSYINAQNFQSARHLAAYLKMLDTNDDLYRQYFWWKPHYRIRNNALDLQLSMCGLCSRLHFDTALQTYDDLEKWWVRDSHCHIPRPNNVFHIPFWLD